MVRWTGARLSDFVEHFTRYWRRNDMPPYVGSRDPGWRLLCGVRCASAMHPQTLLCYEMNGAPLTAEHGAPLRLVIPVKSGVKNLKRIGVIRFAH